MIYYWEGFHGSSGALTFSQIAHLPAQARESNASHTHLQVPHPRAGWCKVISGKEPTEYLSP